MILARKIRPALFLAAGLVLVLGAGCGRGEEKAAVPSGAEAGLESAAFRKAVAAKAADTRRVAARLAEVESRIKGLGAPPEATAEGRDLLALKAGYEEQLKAKAKDARATVRENLLRERAARAARK